MKRKVEPHQIWYDHKKNKEFEVGERIKNKQKEDVFIVYYEGELDYEKLKKSEIQSKDYRTG